MSESDEMVKKFNDTAYDIGKLLISLSTGTVVMSLTFHRGMLTDALRCEYLLVLGWALELASIILGTFFLFSMLRVFDIWQKIHAYYVPAIVIGGLQYISFIGGLITLSVFTGLHLK